MTTDEMRQAIELLKLQMEQALDRIRVLEACVTHQSITKADAILVPGFDT